MSYKYAYIVFRILLCVCLMAGAKKNIHAQHAKQHSNCIGIVDTDTGSLRQMIRNAMAVLPRSPDSAMLLVNEAEFHSRQTEFNKGIFFSLNVRGYLLRCIGLYDSSINVLKLALPFTQRPELIGYAHSVYNAMALSASNTGQHELALHWFGLALKAMSVKRFTDNHTSIDSCTILTNMGVMWSRLGENGQAAKILRQAERAAIKTKSRYDLILAYVNLGQVAQLNSNYDEATSIFRKVLNLTESHDESNFRFCAWGGLAYVYLGQHKPNEALTILRDSMKINEVRDVYLYLHWQHSQGAAFLQLKKYEQAFSFLKKSLDSAVVLNHTELIQVIAPDAARAASAIGRHQDAYRFLGIYTSIRDSMFEKGKARFLRAWTNTQIAEKDKTVIAQKLYIVQQQGQIQLRNFVVAGAFGGLLLLVIIGIWLYRSYRHKQKLQQSDMQQLQQQQEINRLKARVQGEEQERNRIATELHNGIAAQLWGARMNVDMLQRQDSLDRQQKEKLQNIYRQLDETTNDIRKTAHNMMPDLLLGEGLGPALASLCLKTTRNTGLDTEYQEYGNIPRLDHELEHLLYRMIQELIQNVLKHATNATNLLVQLSCSYTILNITVEDNGQGFSVEKAEFGIGLQHISKNVQILGGTIDIKSSKDSGTAIYIEFDIQHLL